MKDEKVPNAFALEEDGKELSLDEIMAADANDDATEDKIINKNRRKTKNKKAALITGTSVLAAAVTAGFLFFSPFGGDLNLNKDQQTNPISSETNSDFKIDPNAPEPHPEFRSGGDVGNEEGFAAEDSNMFPIEMEDWEKKRFNDQDLEEVRSGILVKHAGSELSNSGGLLPSEEGGFTSDITKSSLPDGTLNPMFSFWTAETFNAETNSYIERLVNPTFGGWSGYQYSSYPPNQYFDINLVSDMFTNEWRTGNLEKPYSEYVPIYADWAGNDYGMAEQLLESGSRWYGTVTDTQASFVYDTEELQYTVDVTAEVTFTAWAKDQTKLEKKGTLTLHLVPNIDDANGSGHKVLIESASLKVDG